MSLFELSQMLPNHLLMKVDKMTMAHSIEARVPFLDHKLTELALSLPPKYKIRNNAGKYILRKCMSTILPEEIFSRKKHGFILPLHKWLRRDMKQHVLSVLLDPLSHARNIFSEEQILNLFKKRINPLQDMENVNLSWRLFVFESWYRIYIKNQGI